MSWTGRLCCLLNKLVSLLRSRNMCLAAMHVHALLCRFEELEYADAASYMENGEVVFTGSPAQMVARLRSMGARIR